MTPLPFINNCVNWPRAHVDDLTALVDSARPVSYKMFRSRVDPRDLHRVTTHLGYGRFSTLRIQDDRLVTFWSGLLMGHRVYFFTWSAIEYVFGPDALKERLAV
jgi:hypothetical protein